MANTQRNPFQTIKQVFEGYEHNNMIVDGAIIESATVPRKLTNIKEIFSNSGSTFIGTLGARLQLKETGNSDTKYVFDNLGPDDIFNAYNGVIESAVLSYSGTATGSCTMEVVYYNTAEVVSTQQFKLDLENVGDTEICLNLQFSAAHSIRFRVYGVVGGNGNIDCNVKLKIFE